MGDLGSIPGLGRSPGEGKGYPLQYSGLENSKDCIVHGVARSRTCGARKSGLHARGEGERVLALESREGTRASRRLEEGLSTVWVVLF